ncbi:hypothetical protein K523DRAFT_255457 [Schizophyllum commune Tattone D]|nr:hypothetical protein K523DRAFT_255457 [Schizophyllum commune Tattone D]
MRLYIERAKLEREADAFPPPSATLAPGEVVPLEEDGDTLELLFRFVDREEYVRLEDVKFELLSRVAEAAHKYRVYSAMVACRPLMNAQHDKHPVDVLVYALKHGHADIADAAAPFTVGRRAEEMLKVLPSQAEYTKWVRPSRSVSELQLKEFFERHYIMINSFLCSLTSRLYVLQNLIVQSAPPIGRQLSRH